MWKRQLLVASVLALAFTHHAAAAFVEPAMGGGQIGQGFAPMKHADISFDGASIFVEVDQSVGTPTLVPLSDGFEFDPGGAWGHINGHAYNFQYGWNPGRIDAFPPAGAWFWIEVIDASPELKTYQRPPAAPEGEPIFATEDSPGRWRWSGAMTHNLYAVENPRETEYFATYRVYLGSDAGGTPIAGVNSAEVTFRFLAEPIGLSGDFNGDGALDAGDYTVWRDNLGVVEDGTTLSGNGDGGTVGQSDYELWRTSYEAAALAASIAAPEPNSLLLLLFGVAWSTTTARARAAPLCRSATSRMS